MTPHDPPKVTVFIPIYNREAYVGAAIDSVLAQSFRDFELLLIDDGSTDRSVEVLRSYDDPRVRVVCNGRNLGIPRTRNRGLELARGEYIALLDSDDAARPGRLQKQAAFLDRHPDCVQVGGWKQDMDEHGRVLRKIKRQPTSSADIHAQLLFRCSLTNTTIMGRTATLREYGYRNGFARCQDYDLHVRLAARHKMANLPQVLTYARVHPGQITVRTQELGNTKKAEIMRRQLTNLGVPCVEKDLRAHLMLSRMRKFRFVPDRAYLDWAEAWLLGLTAANRRVRRYSERAFARAVSEKWLQTCWAARAGMGRNAWNAFFQSPLRKGIVARLGQAVHASL